MKIYQISFSSKLLLIIFIGFLLTSCSLKSEPVRVVEEYLKALAAQDQNAISNLTCKDWETQAFIELDALQLVKASLLDLTCQETEIVAGGVIVQCSGKIFTTYNNEISTFDLSQNKYFISHYFGDWLLCGYQ